ncbi:DMT family transporter [Falsiroseomonas selenitidurans]|uniref:DMT family transporter n=1 Tax=Falsiroseomonas selenitidurans TaxID=2716335 RepID=A0ABX1E4X6_9PROT|nr:DMT family transporter [Falsiroseomonas selenitidurans]NKC32237.1 DMT family transporter [Falsiroseomonas selenitidurans]
MTQPALFTGPALWWRLLVIGGLWGCSFPLLRLVAAEMSPFALAACRGGFAALAVFGFLALSGQLQGGWRRFALPALVLGTCNGWVPNLLTALALGRIEAAPAALIHAGTPLLVALLAVPLLRDELPGRRGVAGLLLGFCGIGVILGPDALSGAASFSGGLMILASGVFYALGTIYARRARIGGAPQIVLGQQVVAGLVAGALSVPFAGPGAYAQPAWVFGVLALLGIVTSALPLTLFLRLLARARVTDASMVGYIQPPFAAGVGALLLGEWPEWRVLGGGLVVLAGVWLATSRR